MVLVTMIVLILSYALPKFAVQHIGSSCGATNPLTGAPINILYYNVLHGLGSSPQCTNNATTADFCIEWNSFNIWTRIDQVTHKTDMQFDARLRWQATKVNRSLV